MTELSQKILEQYQIRKTRKQKTAFIELLQQAFPQTIVQKAKIPASRNLIIGDIEKAKVVFSAHYDTCAQLPFPNFIVPMRPFLSVMYSFAVMLPILILILALDYLLGYVTSDFWVIYLVNFIFLAGVLYMIMAGVTNKHNANDNTSGVITVLEILQSLPEGQTDAAFVLFDNEEIGLMGSTYFRKQYKKAMENKLLINFDCVSEGDYIMLAVTQKANQHNNAINTAFCSVGKKQYVHIDADKVYYPSDHIGFPQHIAVAALKKGKRIGYYMDRIHTNRDIIFDEANIELLRSSSTALIECIKNGTLE